MHKKLIAAVLVSALAMAACGGSSDEATDDPAPESTTTAGGDSDADLTIGNDDSSVQVEFNGLPDDFPDVVVLPDGYVALQVQRQEMAGEVGFTAIGTAGSDTQTVFAAMQTAYDDGPPTTLVNGDVHGVTYEDIDGYEISYTMEDNADGLAVVTIAVTPDVS